MANRDKWGLEKSLNQLKAAQSKLPIIISNMAQNHFRKSFKDGGFTDDVFQPWQPRKGEAQRRGPAMVRAKSASSRAVLVKSGDLRRSVKEYERNWRRIVIGSDLVYAKIHNDGLMGRAWGRARFKMPKRQFIGRSRVLETAIQNRIEQEINKIFK